MISDVLHQLLYMQGAEVTSFTPTGAAATGRRVWAFADYAQELSTSSLAVLNTSVQADEIAMVHGNFSAVDSPQFTELLSNYRPPPIVDAVYFPDSPTRSCAASGLSLGAAGSGVGWHFEQQVFAEEVLFGETTWLVSKGVPPGGFNYKQTSLAWVQSEKPVLASAL